MYYWQSTFPGRYPESTVQGGIPLVSIQGTTFDPKGPTFMTQKCFFFKKNYKPNWWDTSLDRTLSIIHNAILLHTVPLHALIGVLVGGTIRCISSQNFPLLSRGAKQGGILMKSAGFWPKWSKIRGNSDEGGGDSDSKCIWLCAWSGSALVLRTWLRKLIRNYLPVSTFRQSQAL